MINKYKVIDDNLELFSLMLRDIESATKNICLEIYRFGQDAMGEKFLNSLINRARNGVRIKVLIDAWGSGTDTRFFNRLIEAGGEVRVYKKLNFERAYFVKNHCRNHRKLIIIDNQIGYIGSSNITSYSLAWRELNLRVEDRDLIRLFFRSFRESFRSFDKYSFSKLSHKRDMHFGFWLFIQDVPNVYRQRVKKQYENMIDKANTEIIIETPYFLPGHILRKKLEEAVSRGVRVRVMTPHHSDVRLVDIIRRKYLGELHLAGVELCFYTNGNLHAKGLMVDNKVFSISSSNFDYRSFRYQYELALIGIEPVVIEQLDRHFDVTYADCKSFNYESWKSRSRIEKFFEWVLLPFRYLF